MATVGLWTNTPFAYTHGETHYITTIGEYVNGIFNSTNETVEQVDEATQRIALTDPTLIIPCVDQDGQNWKKQITAVRRVDMSKIPNKKVARFQNNVTGVIVMMHGTPIATRIDNRIKHKATEEYQAGDMLACGMHGYTTDNNGAVRTVYFQVNDNSPVPAVITITWGELVISRNDAFNFYNSCLAYPDQVDPEDASIFDRVLMEQIYFDTVNRVDNYSPTYHDPYMFWIETEGGCFNMHSANIVFGEPKPGSSDTVGTLSAKGPQHINNTKGSGDAAKILKEQFNKEQSLTTEAGKPTFKFTDETKTE